MYVQYLVSILGSEEGTELVISVSACVCDWKCCVAAGLYMHALWVTIACEVMLVFSIADSQYQSVCGIASFLGLPR